MSNWISIGYVEAIPRLGARVVRTRIGDIAVFRTDDGNVYAIEDRCPHRGGPLSQGIVHGRRVSCPLHDWTVELASGEVVAPGKGCVRRFAVREVGGLIEIDLADMGRRAGAA